VLVLVLEGELLGDSKWEAAALIQPLLGSRQGTFLFRPCLCPSARRRREARLRPWYRRSKEEVIEGRGKNDDHVDEKDAMQELSALFSLNPA
jgi:hypothetical protein